MAGRPDFIARGERFTRKMRERLHRRSPRPADPYTGPGMDRPLTPPPAWRRYGPYGAAAAMLVILSAWVLAGTDGNVYRVPIDRLTIAKVTEGPFEDFAAVQSNVAPLLTDYLTTEQGGTVKQVLVQDGAIVKAGQTLIVLANPALRLQVASQEAETAREISQLQNTELQLEQSRFQTQKDLLDIKYQLQKLKAKLTRDKVLSAAQAIPEVSYQEDKDQYAYELKLRAATEASHAAEQKLRSQQLAQLRDTLKRLNANVAAARASLDALTIRAPIDGQLTALDAKVGQSKPQGAVLGQIDSRNRFKLTAQVDQFYLGRVALGQEALMTVGNRGYRARVAKIHPQVTDGTFKVDLAFLGRAPSGIHNGQEIDIKLELGGAAKAMMLPNGPFYQDTGGNWVFVLTPDGGSAVRRNVRLGRRNPEYVEVLDGLKPGDRVIVSSYEAFAKMDRVEFEKASGDNS